MLPTSKIHHFRVLNVHSSFLIYNNYYYYYLKFGDAAFCQARSLFINFAVQLVFNITQASRKNDSGTSVVQLNRWSQCKKMEGNIS